MLGTGVVYHQWYKWDQLRKIRIAFKAGYDPVLELDSANEEVKAESARRAAQVESELEHFPHVDAHLRRDEQELIDRIIDGKEQGHYYLLMGRKCSFGMCLSKTHLTRDVKFAAKGVGKSTMVVDAIRKNLADGVVSLLPSFRALGSNLTYTLLSSQAMLEAHADAEVVRMRFGKALNFDYYEDSFSGLFQRRDPREGGPLLDIERLMNKLEKVAISYAKERGRPLCMIINNMHLMEQGEGGYAILHALQQRAEAWAQAKSLTSESLELAF